jgi:hypothetical protein
MDRSGGTETLGGVIRLARTATSGAGFVAVDHESEMWMRPGW